MAPQAAWKFYNDAAVTKEIVFAAGVESPANKDQLGRYISTDGATKFYFPSQGEIAHGGSYSNGIGTKYPCGKAWSSTVDADLFPFVRNDGLADLGRLHGRVHPGV